MGEDARSPKVDDLDDGFCLQFRLFFEKNIFRFEVAMDDGPFM